MIRELLAALILIPAAQAAQEFTYWAEPCTPALSQTTACHAADPELAKWAFEAWQRESGNTITFKPSATEQHARIRIHWASGADNLYGETQATVVDGKPGSNIFVLPDVRGLGPDIAQAGTADSLFRDAVVYLTCLHETGHALGLSHTRQFADIMYTFGYGGDILEYFQRYRRLLQSRSDIPSHSGISNSDRLTVRKATF